MNISSTVRKWQHFERISKLIRYALFGGVGATSDFVIYSVMLWVGLPYVLDNICGYVCGTVISFFLNRKFTFKVSNRISLRLLSFLMIAVTGLGVSTLLVQLFVEVFSFQAIPAKLMTLPAVFLLQFTLNSLVTFRRRRDQGLSSLNS